MSQISERSESQYKNRSLPEETKNLVEFYSVMGKCHNIDVTDYINQNEDPFLFDQITQQIKKLINPRLVVHIGNAANLEKTRSLAEKLSFDFLDSQTFFHANQIPNKEMFPDFCFKFVMKEFSENLIIHLDQAFFEEQWQVFLFSLKFHLQSIIYTPTTLTPKQLKFIKELPFDGQRIQLVPNREQLEKEFFKQYQNHLVVFDGGVTDDLQRLVSDHNFHLFDCSLAFDVLSYIEEQHQANDKVCDKGYFIYFNIN